MKKPNRFNRNSHHALFGIENYLRGLGIKNHETQKELIDSFLTANEFTGNAKGKKGLVNQKSVFISNRFQQFINHVKTKS